MVVRENYLQADTKLMEIADALNSLRLFLGLRKRGQQ